MAHLFLEALGHLPTTLGCAPVGLGKYGPEHEPKRKWHVCVCEKILHTPQERLAGLPGRIAWQDNVSLDVERIVLTPGLLSFECHRGLQESLEDCYHRRCDRFPSCPFEQTRREDTRCVLEVAPELRPTPKSSSYEGSSALA